MRVCYDVKKAHEQMNHGLSREVLKTTSIAIIAMFAVLVVVLGALSFSPPYTANAERDFSRCTSGEQGTNNCQKQQSKAFDKCIEKASEDGELTEQEYFTCAYSIYS
jgi:hypothetical protein